MNTVAYNALDNFHFRKINVQQLVTYLRNRLCHLYIHRYLTPNVVLFKFQGFLGMEFNLYDSQIQLNH